MSMARIEVYNYIFCKNMDHQSILIAHRIVQWLKCNDPFYCVAPNRKLNGFPILIVYNSLAYLLWIECLLLCAPMPMYAHRDETYSCINFCYSFSSARTCQGALETVQNVWPFYDVKFNGSIGLNKLKSISTTNNVMLFWLQVHKAPAPGWTRNRKPNDRLVRYVES